jgi:hypothetical protein
MLFRLFTDGFHAAAPFHAGKKMDFVPKAQALLTKQQMLEENRWQAKLRRP